LQPRTLVTDLITPAGPDVPSAAESALPTVSGFEILGLLGRGGMGVVYKARQARLKRLVALKMILGGEHARPELLARFRSEAEAAARLRHPNIVQVYEVGEEVGRPYLVMEFVEGVSLARRLAQSPLAAMQAAQVVGTLAGAVHYAHQRGVIHRDLNPNNILVEVEGGGWRVEEKDTNHPPPATLHLKITDFGLAKLVDAEGGTQTGAVLGTPSYMAPEQATGQAREAGPAVDVYALGAVLYEVLTGRPPFKAATALATLEQVCNQEPVSIARLQPDVPRDLQVICSKCLEKEPRKRYASAHDLAEDLGRFLRREPIQARPVGRIERLLKWSRRRPLAAALAAVSFLAVAVLLTGGAIYNHLLREAVGRAEANAQDAAQQRDRADGNYRKARAALGHILERLHDDGLAQMPRAQELQRDVWEDALAYYQSIMQGMDSVDPEVQWDALQACQQTATLQILLNKRSAARENLQRMSDQLEALVARYPDEVRYRSALAGCYSDLNVAGAGPRTQQNYERAVALAEETLQADPDNPAYQGSLAKIHDNFAGFLRTAGHNDLAESHYQKAIAILDALIQRYPRVEAFRAQLADSSHNQALFYAITGKPNTALAAYQKARALLEPLVRDYPGRLNYATSLTMVYLNFGNLLFEKNRYQEAFRCYNQGIDLLEPIVKKEPAYDRARNGLVLIRGGRAMARYRLGFFAESVKDWDRMIELAEGPDRDRYRASRALVLALKGDYQRAMAEATGLAASPHVQTERFYLACACSLSAKRVQNDSKLPSPERLRLAEDYGAAAVGFLKDLRKTDYFKSPGRVESLERAEELTPIRGRQDYQQLVKELKKKP
jgi:tetratricopeptide (TPR) repeat protein/tRNA A-37 threonylcarbamoyl transferase component Bud32